ncbi:hypothetical protein DCCM_3599 [Desulfocucumis palustris]|uniref:Uncharacterized protein n=1 Tax=Desulfocucumis palustris TaxID=1898651 RepID=A0A2L2XKN4_9FIRM|nr:hypothetical protein [Desulfocucumis palustris]GBF34481.1 hypothetical protein DCCM_3599 [Desulfocucumis palustris]
MVNINTEGMEVASLNDIQLQNLMEIEKKLNGGTNKTGEIYLLAVTRRT